MVRRPARIACVLLALALGCDRASDRTTAPAASEPAPPPPAPPEFVGSARCAGCHASETQQWRGSHHDQAMQEANGGDGARRLRRRALRALRIRVQLLPARRALLREHGGAGRRARRLRDRIHLRRRSAPAIPRAPAGRPPPGAQHGIRHPASRGRRPALVPPLPGRGRARGRRAALDEAFAELERAVRGVSLDESAQGLRPREGQLRHELVRARRRLRGLSRAGLAARGVGGCGRTRRRAGRARPRAHAALPPRARPRAGCSRKARPSRTASPRCPRSARSRPARPAMRGARRCARGGGPASRCSTRIGRRCSSPGSTRRTGRCGTRSTCTARSCRAACTPRA